MCSQSQWRVIVRPSCVQSVSSQSLHCQFPSAQHDTLIFPAPCCSQAAVLTVSHRTAITSVCLHCPPRHSSPHGRPCRYAVCSVPLTVTLFPTVRVISLARFIYGYCNLHNLTHNSQSYCLCTITYTGYCLLITPLVTYIFFSVCVSVHFKSCVPFTSSVHMAHPPYVSNAYPLAPRLARWKNELGTKGVLDRKLEN